MHFGSGHAVALDGQPLHMGAGEDGQVLAVPDRLRNALAVFQRMPERWLTSKKPEPSLSPRLKSSFPECRPVWPPRERLPARPSAASPFPRAIRRRRHVCRRPPVEVFRLPEEWQHIVPAPALAAHLAPLVVVAGLAAHIDHAVDRGAAAKHLAARIADGATVQARLGFRLEAPVGARLLMQ